MRFFENAFSDKPIQRSSTTNICFFFSLSSKSVLYNFEALSILFFLIPFILVFSSSLNFDVHELNWRCSSSFSWFRPEKNCSKFGLSHFFPIHRHAHDCSLFASFSEIGIYIPYLLNVSWNSEFFGVLLLFFSRDHICVWNRVPFPFFVLTFNTTNN